ncbi:MAG: hypothetical protein GXC76_09630 [Rhodanobacteraceae bacterium]|jgi:hypothetical protein|nr:hypothetical protein [Rhodanobacteraceae bacterium]
MSLRQFLSSLALGLAITTAGAADAQATIESNSPEARIVGMWHMYVSVGSCTDPNAPPNQFFALNTFHAGGTLSDTNSFPPTARGPGQGVWSYNHRTRQFVAHMNFMRFVNGAFDGLQDATTTIPLGNNPRFLHGTIHAYMRNVDGSVRAELCGTVDGERVGVDYQPL